MKNTKIDGDMLFMIEHDKYGIWYFDSLYRAAEFLGCQRAQVEYSFLRNKPYHGWVITVVDGADTPWSWINCSHEKYIEIVKENGGD